MKTLLLITSLFLLTSFNIKTNHYNMNIDEYVDDIPFDTYEIYEKYKDTTINYQDENYIDDIPFDTYEIYEKNK